MRRSRSTKHVAHNKRLEGRGTGPSLGQQKMSGQASNYKPRFHCTTAFVDTMEESDAKADHHQETPSTEEVDSPEKESPQDDDDGLFIPSYLEEAAPDDPVLQVKMARAMRALKKETQRCYRCNQQGHLQKDCKETEEKMVEGPSHRRGLFKPNRRRRDQS